jgi:type IV pilus assembly protein PilX
MAAHPWVRSSLAVRRRTVPSLPSRSQQGVVMIITLIVLVVLMVGAVALWRSSDTSAALAGQLAFRRDLKNQGERGFQEALTSFDSGDLSTASARTAAVKTANYSAIKLASNDQGIPKILLQDEDSFTAAGMEKTDLEDTTSGVKVRTVIDRQCSATGESTDANCTRVTVSCGTSGGETQNGMGGEVLSCTGTAYRISVRVDGPRSTQAFFQMVVAQ